jgi:hypothetical protein
MANQTTMDYLTTITYKGNLYDISGQAKASTIHSSVVMAGHDVNKKFWNSENMSHRVEDSHIMLITDRGEEIYSGSYENFDLAHLVVTGTLSDRNKKTQYQQC